MRAVAARIVVFLAVCVPIITGCSAGSVPGTVPVTGSVTYKAQPVAGATVSFIGEGSARMAVAVTDAAGNYELITLDTKGALPGMYTVLVAKTEAMPGADVPISMDEAAKNTGQAKEPKRLLPAKYGDAAKSPLKFEVKKGQANTFDLQLAD